MVNKLDKLATKEDLKKGLGSLDKKLSKRIDDSTKVIGDLRNEMSRFKISMDLRFEDQDEKLGTQIKEFRSEVLGILSDVMGEFKDMREERTILVDRSGENRDKLDNHEVRIDRLESVVVSA
jgi:phage host-nuclease inhibitor protein Gam